jgi:hypothetical protein
MLTNQLFYNTVNSVEGNDCQIKALETAKRDNIYYNNKRYQQQQHASKLHYRYYQEQIQD